MTEWIAVIFGILCVLFTIKQNIWCWPTGLVQVLLFIYIFYEAKLYSDLILHVIYVFMQIYGWYYWLYGGVRESTLVVSRLTQSVFMIWILFCIVCTGFWGWIMSSYTSADVPYPDAFTTVASLIAQWLLARKKMESWIFWISVDVVAIGVYSYKELYLTAGLYSVFLVLAIMGLFTWKKSISQQTVD